MKIYFTLLITLGLTLISPAALAHGNHLSHSLFNGFIHVMTGPDHLLALILTGILITRLNTKKTLATGVVLSALASGSVLTLLVSLNYSTVLQTGWIELAVLLSIPVFTSLIVIQKSTQLLTVTLLSLFMFVHGMAHGIELSSFSNTHFVAGNALDYSLEYLSGLLLTSLLIITATTLLNKKLNTGFTYLKHV